MSAKRKKDIIEHLEEIAARSGSFQKVSEKTYQEFINLSDAEIDRLSVVIMLNQEKDVDRLAGNLPKAEAVKRVTEFVDGFLWMIARGFCAVDIHGGLVMTARDGPDPSEKMSEKIELFRKRSRLLVEETVIRALPWFLEQKNRQRLLHL